MSAVRLTICICALVALQISHSHAKVDPSNTSIDPQTGLKRLHLNGPNLSSAEIEQVREITSTRAGHEGYCKFKAVKPDYPWLMPTLGIENWCFNKDMQSTCCLGEGKCICPHKGRYKCYCE